MDARQAAALRPTDTVRWTLSGLPEAVVLDLNPAWPEPLGYRPRGRYVRIGWPKALDRPYVDVWTDDLIFVTRSNGGPSGEPFPTV